MRAVLMTFCLITAGPAAAWAQSDDESTPVYDFSDGGGVVVLDPGAGAPAPPGARGQLTVIQNNGGPDQGAYWYYGPHPDGAGGWDPTEGAHTHDYPPFDEYLFTQENGYYYFIGDPADFGYEGNDLYGYYGVHPIALAYGGGYCYYPGYHHHWWVPWGSYFVVTSGWYWWNGPFSPWFNLYRDRYDRYFRDVYPRIHYARPPVVHTAQPPPRPQRAGVIALPVQRLRSPGAPARAGWGYVAPPRPLAVRPLAARPMPAPVHLAPAPHGAPMRGAPVRAAPAPSTRRH